jgi:integrase
MTREVFDRDFQALLRAAPPCVRRVLIFCRATGCRAGELCGAKWQHVDWRQNALLVFKQQRWRPPHVIALPAVAVKLLRWLERRRSKNTGHDFVFTNQKGQPWQTSALSGQVSRTRHKAGVGPKVSLCSLRHTFALRAIRNGVPHSAVAASLGLRVPIDKTLDSCGTSPKPHWGAQNQ